MGPSRYEPPNLHVKTKYGHYGQANAMIKLVMTIIVLRRRKNVRLLIKMTALQKLLAMTKANLMI
jgi:hypothetical protein